MIERSAILLMSKQVNQTKWSRSSSKGFNGPIGEVDLMMTSPLCYSKLISRQWVEENHALPRNIIRATKVRTVTYMSRGVEYQMVLNQLIHMKQMDAK